MAAPQSSPLPEAPTRGEAEGQFVPKANAFVSSLEPFRQQLQAQADFVNERSTETEENAELAQEASEMALSSANFAGDWSGLSGAFDVPTSVLHDDTYWQLLEDVSNIQDAEPGVSAVWAPINVARNVVLALPDITSLSSLNPAALVDGQQFSVGGEENGRLFVWSQSRGDFIERTALTAKEIEQRGRAPSRADNGDFIPGQFWRAPDGIYRSGRTSNGRWASWVKQRRATLSPGEVLAPDAIWWLSRVVDDYSGPCINVTNEVVGNSLDIGFDSAGNLDVKSLEKHLGASRGLVNTWYDQSGNGHHAISSGSNRPVISRDNKVGNHHGIVFETEIITQGTPDPDQHFEIPASLSGDSKNVSFLCFCSLASTVRNAPIIELSGSDGNTTAFGKRDQGGASGLNLYQNSTLRVNSEYQPKVGDNVFVAAIGNAATVWGNDTGKFSGTPALSVSYSGGKIGGATDIFLNGLGEPQNGGAIMAGLAVYNTELSELNQRALFESVVAPAETNPQYRGNLIFDGDSITEGVSAEYFDSYPRVINESVIWGSNVYQVARSGARSEDLNNFRPRWQDAIYKSNAPYNIIVLAVGTNDIGGGAVASDIYNNIVAYVNSVKVTGYDVVLSTILPRQRFEGNQEEVERQALNQLLRDNWAALGCLGIVDYDNEGTMGSYSFVENTDYYIDGTHPTTLGYALMATYVRDTIEPILKRQLYAYYAK